MNENNLEYTLNKLGFDIVNSSQKDKEILRFIDKALGVLSNDGVYAYYVFCLSKDKKDDKKYSDIFIKKPIETLKPFYNLNIVQLIKLKIFFRNCLKIFTNCYFTKNH